MMTAEAFGFFLALIMIVLCNYVTGITWVNAGHIPFSTMLAAFEDWKFQTLRERSET